MDNVDKKLESQVIALLYVYNTVNSVDMSQYFNSLESFTIEKIPFVYRHNDYFYLLGSTCSFSGE